jgi:hypothetical protein
VAINCQGGNKAERVVIVVATILTAPKLAQYDGSLYLQPFLHSPMGMLCMEGMVSICLSE